MRTCVDCGVEKPLTEYYPHKTSIGGLTRCCKPCKSKRSMVSRAKRDSDDRWVWALKKKYGMTPEDYNRMLSEQGGVCAICKETCRRGRRLAVDHDHETGEVRGLLCIYCNVSLGGFQDDPARLLNAFAYITQHTKEPAHV